jgi:hypothetical protein
MQQRLAAGPQLPGISSIVFLLFIWCIRPVWLSFVSAARSGPSVSAWFVSRRDQSHGKEDATHNSESEDWGPDQQLTRKFLLALLIFKKRPSRDQV